MNNSINNLSFQKRLIANCKIVDKGKSVPCQIYELSKRDDVDYFQSLLKDRSWKGQGFVEYINDIFSHSCCNDAKYYAIENAKNKKLGFCQIYQEPNQYDELEIIEVMPKAAHDNSSRTAKYIGETLITFLVEKAKKEGKKSFVVPVSIPDARDFYKNCGFERYGDCSFLMKAKNFDNLINKNIEHTGSAIDFVG